MEQEASEVVLFFGRFHPLLLHLPIGFLVMACLLEAFSRVNRFRQLKGALGFVLLLGAVSAVFTAALGYMLAQAGGYDEELLFIHQWTGIALAFTAVAVFGLHRLLQAKPSAVLDRVYCASLVLMMIFLAVAGHFGGSLTHGSDYLTAHMPDGLRKIAGLPAKESSRFQKITNLKEAVLFDDIVYPILDTRCVSCHNESKRKGDLMLDTKEALLKGGEGGAVIVAGNPEASELIKRLHLPISDDDHMPPDGKKQLTDDQMALLSWWIREGASFNKTVAEVTVDDQVQAILHALADPDANKNEVELLLAAGVQPAEKQKILALKEKGVAVIPLAMDTDWLQAKVSRNQSGYPADSLMKDLMDIADQITWLDLGATGITDEALDSIGRFRNLTRLHLENTRVTDQGLQYLKELKYLEYLNLYGTEITDKGVKQLAGLKNLRNLYVWQTQVSQEGILLLRESLPELEVHTGMEVSVESLTFADQ